MGIRSSNTSMRTSGLFILLAGGAHAVTALCVQNFPSTTLGTYPNASLPVAMFSWFLNYVVLLIMYLDDDDVGSSTLVQPRYKPRSWFRRVGWWRSEFKKWRFAARHAFQSAVYGVLPLVLLYLVAWLKPDPIVLTAITYLPLWICGIIGAGFIVIGKFAGNPVRANEKKPKPANQKPSALTAS